MKITTLAQVAFFAVAVLAAADASAKDVDPANSQTATIAVGESLPVKLPCNPGTGYEWEVKSVNKKIAAPAGDIGFEKDDAKPGLVGAGGTCVATFKGVKPGRTTAVLVYRRSWEKVKPAKTFTVHLKVLAKKSH